MPNKKKSEPEEAVVVSFRAPESLVKELDEMARGDARTRANFMVQTLKNAASLEPAIRVISEILPRLVREVDKNPDSPQAEHWRGMMAGARWMLGSFYGDRAMRWVNQQVRRKTNLPMPSTVPLQDDGERYGIDTESDFPPR